MFRILTRHHLIHFSSLVRPNPPLDVKLVGASASTMDLSYKIDNDLHYFPPGLEQDVEYRSQYDPQDRWTRKIVPYVNTTAVEHDVPLDANTTFTQLLPYTKYFVKVRIWWVRYLLFGEIGPLIFPNLI